MTATAKRTLAGTRLLLWRALLLRSVARLLLWVVKTLRL
jgi:hypothetical protein